ncbi:hypothetical protein [Ramlibacter montanisoli]|uniref:Uncharacterized protein n=1 Tax=Ramlibacter montanisoli TaxID=2732512 RepID=A0A849KA77_9BURK|nr:hypothetical protein [Ramlibacter montanisoli]NNU42406.1 hypothetical protein [Ramlibacter montanisoli]
MSRPAPSRKYIAALEAAGDWSDQDVVVSGTDAQERAVRISRSEAAVPAALVRRWLQVRDALREPRLKVVAAFVSADGFLFIASARPER